jgi:hypothetical protein
MDKWDFSGWATRNDLLCGDGRTIRKNAFKDNDGETVPLIWNHDHSNQDAVLGHALLENRDDGVYAYCKFNEDTEQGKMGKKLVEHGDVRSLSIYANKLKQIGNDVIHGSIKELSLVLAGANPGAYIDFVMAHGDEEGDAVIVNYDENALVIYHSDDKETKEEEKVAEEVKKTEESEETVADVFNTLTDKQKNVVYAMLGQALEHSDESDEDDESEEESEGGNETMKHNVFDQEEVVEGGVLSHADQESIITMAKQNNIGTLQMALKTYSEQNKNTLAHGIDEIESLFPDYKTLGTGAPETLERDQTWVGRVMRGTHKSPISRIRTRLADARGDDLRAYGYKQKGDEKKIPGNVKLLKRTTDPQTIYRKDAMHRDDIIDITDFDVVAYQWGIMRRNLEEEIARAIMIGDGRDEGDEMKIAEEHIRSIWNDDDLYTIHYDVDVEAARAEIQGTDTNAYFGENYIYSEAIVNAALYSREKYKGSGSLELYCTPHLLNIMLLARDRNGRRIYSSKSDLAAALNVTAINTVEQFEGQVRTDKNGNKKKLLGLFVNLADYQIGATKGGEITKFDQFDIDFNTYKYLIETRISGALIRPFSAIALEEPVQ